MRPSSSNFLSKILPPIMSSWGGRSSTRSPSSTMTVGTSPPLPLPLLTITCSEPGTIEFSKPSYLVKESVEVALLPLQRSNGADGTVVVSWRYVTSFLFFDLAASSRWLLMQNERPQRQGGCTVYREGGRGHLRARGGPQEHRDSHHK